MPTPLAFVERLDRISLVRDRVAHGQEIDRLVLAVFVVDERIAGDRPVLAGAFTPRVTDDGSQLVLRGVFDADRGAGVEVRVSGNLEYESARLVDPHSGEDQESLGERAKLRLEVARTPHAPPAQAARLRAAGLWALIGERVDTPCQPATFDAAVLGAHLVRETSPSLFHPGAGTWVLLKTVRPDELYFAFDVATGAAEFFPKTPNQPNAAARALFYAL